MSRPIRGAKARIDWGYFAAAAIEGYTAMQMDDGRWSLRATAIDFDAFKIRQRPLVFIAPWRAKDQAGQWQDGEWRWPIKTIDLGEGHGPRELQAVLGAQLPEMITK